MSFSHKTTSNTSRIQSSTANITQQLTCEGDVSIENNCDISGNLDISGNTTLYGNLVANSVTVSPVQLSYLGSISSDVQTQLSNLFFQPVAAVSGSTSPYTIAYSSLGDNVFYIPSDYSPTANFNLIIQDIPLLTTKTYIATLLYRQATGTYYCNGVRVSDTATGYSFSGASGTNSSSTYCVPYFNGGAPLLVAYPNIIIQQFSIISIPTSGGIYTRYITSSVNNFY